MTRTTPRATPHTRTSTTRTHAPWHILRADDRGSLNEGWLNARYSFSFADYVDPQRTHFRALRVMNDDRIAPAGGFGMHRHQDMEIITVVLEGELAHADSLGNAGTIRPGEVQTMTAGSGIRHSERNPSSTHGVHLYQIWLFPSAKSLTPGYAQKAFAQELQRGELVRIAGAPGAEDGALTINTDAHLYRAQLRAGSRVSRAIGPGRGAWVQVMAGSIELAGQTLREGDGAWSDEPGTVELTATSSGADVLLFDLA